MCSLNGECDLYSQAGYGPVILQKPPKNSIKLTTLLISHSFSLSTELLTEQNIQMLSSVVFTIPILSDVCTRPGISRLIFAIPLGSIFKAVITFDKQSCSKQS